MQMGAREPHAGAQVVPGGRCAGMVVHMTWE
jgi:hypothetical protein